MRKIEQARIIEVAIFILALLLALVGIVSVYSARGYFASVVIDDPFAFVQRQALFVSVGVVIAILVIKLKYSYFKMYKLLMFAIVGMIVTLLILLAFVPAINGAKGWIAIGAFSFQPAELAKIILVWLMAFYFAEGRYLPDLVIPDEASKSWQYWGSHHREIVLWGGLVGIMLPVLMQPDTGGFAILFATVLLMWLASGTLDWKKGLTYLGITAASVSALVLIAANFLGSSDYRIRRILVFLNPFSVAADDSRQIRNSFYALSRGGIFGVGLGNSVQKSGYLPESHTDFILAIIGEELGLIGVLIIVGMLFALIGLIYYRSLSMKMKFDKYMLIGIATLFLVQTAFNVAGVVSLAPLTGVTLPFISYGGSSILTSSIAIGIVLKISIYERTSGRKER